VAALVALVTHGWFDALLMLGAVIVVQQVRGTCCSRCCWGARCRCTRSP
jgi:hypothetical protein